MNKKTLSLVKRSCMFLGCIFAAVWVVCSAQGYDAYPFSYVPFTMCTITALTFFLTGAALFADSSEADE